MRYSMALAAAFAAVSLAGPLETGQSADLLTEEPCPLDGDGRPCIQAKIQCSDKPKKKEVIKCTNATVAQAQGHKAEDQLSPQCSAVSAPAAIKRLPYIQGAIASFECGFKESTENLCGTALFCALMNSPKNNLENPQNYTSTGQCLLDRTPNPRGLCDSAESFTYNECRRQTLLTEDIPMCTEKTDREVKKCNVTVQQCEDKLGKKSTEDDEYQDMLNECVIRGYYAFTNLTDIVVG